MGIRGRGYRQMVARYARSFGAIRRLHRSLGAEWRKSDLANYLIGACGYRNYLEVCTIGNESRFSEIDRSRLSRCDRLLYRCADSFTDGFDITFRSPDDRIDACMSEIGSRGIAYDIALVDSRHEYALSYRDIAETMKILRPGGTLIVHDCIPIDERSASPHEVASPWTGVTYKAFVDFVMADPQYPYAVVESDCGCGVIRKADASGFAILESAAARFHSHEAVLRSWQAVGEDYHRAYRLFAEHRKLLANPVSVRAFLAAVIQPLSL